MATGISRAISKNISKMISCSVVIDSEHGCQGPRMTVLAIISIGGVQEVLEWKPAPDER